MVHRVVHRKPFLTEAGRDIEAGGWAYYSPIVPTIICWFELNFLLFFSSLCSKNLKLAHIWDTFRPENVQQEAMRYIYRRPNGYYYFRMRLPVDLQPLLGVKYLKKTLKLKDIDDKKRFQSRLYVEVQKFIFTLREYMPKKEDADRSK